LILPASARPSGRPGQGLDFNSRDLGRGTPIVFDSDPRWNIKTARLNRLRMVRARASELGLKLARIGGAQAK